MSTVLVTGASGFIGRALCLHLVADGWQVRGTVRRQDQVTLLPHGVVPEVTGDLTASPRWSAALQDVDAVVHLAVHHHVLGEPTAGDIELFRRVNVSGSRILAEQAARAGVRRLVYLSSAKVHGEGRETSYLETDLPRPETPYGCSKWEAEQQLWQVAGEARMELCILRPPLVYGAEVQANFLRLLQWLDSGRPLPLGRVKNRRSMLYIGNLVAVVAECLRQPTADGETFLVGDGDDCSTPELLVRVADLMGRTARLTPIPAGILQCIGRLSGRGKMVKRLTGSFTIDTGKLRRTLDWDPPYSLQEGLEETVRWFLQSKHRQ